MKSCNCVSPLECVEMQVNSPLHWGENTFHCLGCVLKHCFWVRVTHFICLFFCWSCGGQIKEIPLKCFWRENCCRLKDWQNALQAETRGGLWLYVHIPTLKYVSISMHCVFEQMCETFVKREAADSYLCSGLFDSGPPLPGTSTAPHSAGGSDPKTLRCHSNVGVAFHSTSLNRHTQRVRPWNVRGDFFV